MWFHVQGHPENRVQFLKEELKKSYRLSRGEVSLAPCQKKVAAAAAIACDCSLFQTVLLSLDGCAPTTVAADRSTTPPP